MVMVTTPGMMDPPMTVSGLTTKSMERVSTSGQMVVHTKDSGRITTCMVEVSILGKTAGDT